MSMMCKFSHLSPTKTSGAIFRLPDSSKSYIIVCLSVLSVFVHLKLTVMLKYEFSNELKQMQLIYLLFVFSSGSVLVLV